MLHLLEQYCDEQINLVPHRQRQALLQSVPEKMNWQRDGVVYLSFGPFGQNLTIILL
jgi:hypothetical protein